MAKTFAKKVAGKFVNPKAAPAPVKSVPKAAPTPQANPFAQVFQDTKKGQLQSTRSTPTFSASTNNAPNQFIPNASPLTPANMRVSPNTGASKPIDQVTTQPVASLPQVTDRMQASQSTGAPNFAPWPALQPGMVTETTAAQKFTGSIPGQALQGFQQGMVAGKDPMGRDITTMGPAHNVGYVAGVATSLIGLKSLVQGATNAIGKLSAAKNLPKVGMLAPELDLLGNEISMSSAARTMQANAKTERLIANVATKAAIEKGKPLITAAKIGTAISTVIGSYVWAGHLRLDNIIGSYSIGIRDAKMAGDEQGAASLQQELNDFMDEDVWETVQNAIPGWNVKKAIDDGYKAARSISIVNQKIIDDLKTQQDTGETEDAKWARVSQEKKQQETENVDYYNSERKKMMQWEQESKRLADIAQNNLDKKQRQEEADFWRSEREKQSQLEAADRKAIGDFWAAYRKKAQKIAEDQRPSKLNFGII